MDANNGMDNHHQTPSEGELPDLEPDGAVGREADIAGVEPSGGVGRKGNTADVEPDGAVGAQGCEAGAAGGSSLPGVGMARAKTAREKAREAEHARGTSWSIKIILAAIALWSIMMAGVMVWPHVHTWLTATDSAQHEITPTERNALEAEVVATFKQHIADEFGGALPRTVFRRLKAVRTLQDAREEATAIQEEMPELKPVFDDMRRRIPDWAKQAKQSIKTPYPDELARLLAHIDELFPQVTD